MNEQKAPGGIEWTRIRTPAGVTLPGYTWNPTQGCLHDCTWKMPDGSVAECYAKTVFEKFQMGAAGFKHHYWKPEKLHEPLKLSTPAGIFVGSMADLFGHWVGEDEIEAVIETMETAHWHTFLTLSKYPNRLPHFNPYPANVWVGVSLPAGHTMSKSGAARALRAYLKHMQRIKATVRFMSIEPLWFDVAPVLEQWIAEHGELPFDWAIIGAASNGRTIYQPDPAHVAALHDVLDLEAIPVFHKGNLHDNPWVQEHGVRADFYGAQPPHTFALGTTRIGALGRDPDVLDITIKSGHTPVGQELAPASWDMVKGVKDGSISWERYAQWYTNLLRSRYGRDPLLWRQIVQQDRLILACYCTDPACCHRTLAKDALKKVARANGYIVVDLGEVLPAQPALFDLPEVKQPIRYE